MPPGSLRMSCTASPPRRPPYCGRNLRPQNASQRRACAFVQLRELFASDKEPVKRLDQLEARLDEKLISHDEDIATILSAIRQLIHPPPAKRRGIGFTADISDPK